MPTKKAQLSIYQLKITLIGIEPPIWRDVQVSSSIPLCCLHDAFQAVMGWTDSHLHQFENDGKYWGIPDDDALRRRYRDNRRASGFPRQRTPNRRGLDGLRLRFRRQLAT